MSVRILYLHGMASSHACPIAERIRTCMPEAEVIAPDLSIDPDAAFPQIDRILEEEHIDVIVGHSLGGFMAQKYRGWPKVLVNPSLGVTYLRLLKGRNRYRMERHDGVPFWYVTDGIYRRYKEMEDVQYRDLPESEKELTIGCFGRRDPFTQMSSRWFSGHYTQRVMMPGGHYPSEETVRDYIVPAIRKLAASARWTTTDRR